MTSCPICLEECDHSFVMPCGHAMHHSCAIQNAWRGNIGCPICRAIPLGIDKDEAEQLRGVTIMNWEADQINKLCRSACGLVRKNSAKLTKQTKNAVLAFQKLKKKIQNEKAKELEYRRNFAEMSKQLRNDINALAPTYQEQFSINIKKFINVRSPYHYRCWREFRNRHRRETRQIENAKRLIAESMGFQSHSS